MYKKYKQTSEIGINRCEYTCGRQISGNRSIQVQVWSVYLLAENNKQKIPVLDECYVKYFKYKSES